MFLFESWLFRILETNHFPRLHSVFSAVVMNSSCNRKSCSICEPQFSISSCWTQACWPGQQCLRNAGWHSCHRGLFSFWTALQEWLRFPYCSSRWTGNLFRKMQNGRSVEYFVTRSHWGKIILFPQSILFLCCFLCRWVTSGHYLLC